MDVGDIAPNGDVVLISKAISETGYRTANGTQYLKPWERINRHYFIGGNLMVCIKDEEKTIYKIEKINDDGFIE